VWFVLAALCLLPAGAHGQAAGPHPRREIPGFDFRRDGVWRKRARQVAARRAALLAGRQFGALNAPLAAGGGPTLTALTGTLRVPAILFSYKDTPAPDLRDTAQYNAVLFSTTPPLGRPYTFRTFYQQLSHGLFDVQGETYGYAALDSNEVTYAGAPPCNGNPFGTPNCNGLFDNNQAVDPVHRMQNALQEALSKLDASIDWTQYDSNGDGDVDLVVFLQPAQDGACGGANNNHLWSHRYSLFTPYITHDGKRVSDYLLQSALGGASACDSTQIMPIGTVAHETGHGLGLPDLYDTQGPTEGIGDWGLMGAGNYTSALSPSRMEAWSLNELGWVTVAPLTAGGSYSVDAAPVSDTAFYLRPRGSNPRGEYFLLENRQRSESDTAMIRVRCQRSSAPSNCPGGLLIWHVDSTQLVNGAFGNTINYGPIHGLALVQADGLTDLDAPRNRGDAGDAYPGIAKPGTPSPLNPNVVFSPASTPAARKNGSNSSVGFAIDSIRQLVPNGVMRFRLQFGQPLVYTVGAHGTVTPNPPGATSGSFIADSTAVTLTAVADAGYIFAGWTGDTTTLNTVLMLSMVRPYTVTANFGTALSITSTDTLPAASMGTAYVYTLHASGGTGAYTWQLVGAAPPTLALSASGMLTGTPSQLGTFSFQAMVTSGALTQTHTFTVTTTAPALTTAAVVAKLLTGSGPLTPGEVTYLDLIGNQNGQFDVGDFLAWVDLTGAP
jgi:M6 family metalloprotease-like protein/uncharacterized repeat protein (TIGR02543 family)